MPTDITSAQPPAICIAAFDPKHHTYQHFDCGVSRLNNYLHLTAKKQQTAHITRVFVLTEEGRTDVLGYYAVNMGAIDGSALTRPPKSLPRHGRLPVLFLGQIAVTNQAQNTGFGKIMMYHLFLKACILADQAGCYALILDVISDGGEEAFIKRKGWYQSFGFQAFPSDPQRLFLTITQIRQIVPKYPK